MLCDDIGHTESQNIFINFVNVSQTTPTIINPKKHWSKYIPNYPPRGTKVGTALQVSPPHWVKIPTCLECPEIFVGVKLCIKAFKIFLCYLVVRLWCLFCIFNVTVTFRKLGNRDKISHYANRWVTKQAETTTEKCRSQVTMHIFLLIWDTFIFCCESGAIHSHLTRVMRRTFFLDMGVNRIFWFQRVFL